MEISNYTTEDFVLDPSFRKWVMQPNAASNLFWEDLLTKNPSKYKAAKEARKIILKLNTKNQPKLSDAEISGMWNDMDTRMSEAPREGIRSREEKVIPLHSLSTLERAVPNAPHHSNFFADFRFRVACILAMAIGFGYLSSWLLSTTVIQEENPPVSEFVEHKTVPGVKSHLTLSDGSLVILNSGSELRYIKNFEKGRREVHLKGEAFFSVARDSMRPFIVHSRETTTIALGTSFNVKAYEGETLDVSLLTGKVAIKRDGEAEEVRLVPGEALKIGTEKEQLEKTGFNPDLVIGWTKKRIIFQETPLMEVIRVLENWYGVEIQLIRKPKEQVLLSGKFQDETLENVLEGLKFSARFDFTIDKENVKIIF
ncbi:FecR family protein [Cyclobacterium salsum]|uniref:FecR family protein n=1 Tax=Cyclobacterium salsum TaxID=2666329 RepID=UPI001390D80F|nr:FecR family protein [Cyclobacterium salsum]